MISDVVNNLRWTLVITPYADFNQLLTTINAGNTGELARAEYVNQPAYKPWYEIREPDRWSLVRPVFQFASSDTVCGEELRQFENKFGFYLNFCEPVNDQEEFVPNADKRWNFLLSSGIPINLDISTAYPSDCVSSCFNMLCYYYPKAFSWVNRK